jgi:hypothetical protein
MVPDVARTDADIDGHAKTHLGLASLGACGATQIRDGVNTAIEFDGGHR